MIRPYCFKMVQLGFDQYIPILSSLRLLFIQKGLERYEPAMLEVLAVRECVIHSRYSTLRARSAKV